MLTLTLLAVLQAATVTLEAPAGAIPAELSLASKALEKRCAAYGYAGISATVENGHIVVRCPKTDISPGMADGIERLAGMCGGKYEIRCKRLLTAAEKDQFSAPEKDPPGGKWFRLMELVDGRFANPTYVSLKDAGSIGKPDLKIIKKTNADLGVDEWFLEIPKVYGNKLFEERAKFVEGFADEATYLVLDNVAFDNAGLLKWVQPEGKAPGVWTFGPLDKLMSIAIQHPLPFVLKPKK
jgi:hypothetical protein